jgi:cysteinyl-tRNA synthetase
VQRGREIVEKLSPDGSAMTQQELANQEQINALKEKYEAAMDDDFNTADAIAAIFELVKLSNITLTEQSTYAYASEMVDTIEKLCDILGIITQPEEDMLDADIEALIAERQQARKDKDFARADAIRDELLAKGIVLKDTRDGVKWSRA